MIVGYNIPSVMMQIARLRHFIFCLFYIFIWHAKCISFSPSYSYLFTLYHQRSFVNFQKVWVKSRIIPHYFSWSFYFWKASGAMNLYFLLVFPRCLLPRNNYFFFLLPVVRGTLIVAPHGVPYFFGSTLHWQPYLSVQTIISGSYYFLPF